MHRRRPDEQEYDLVELSPVRKAIGERTALSFSTKPHFSTTVLVDATHMTALRSELKAKGLTPLPTYNDILVKLCADVLTRHRRLNAWLDDEGLKVLRHINIAIATATEQGVLLPVVHDADKKSLSEVAAETRELIELARAGKLRASLQMGGGFLVSNIGPGRVEWFTAVISPPMVAVLSVGSMGERPMAIDGAVEVRPSFYATLTVDHQAIDGADSAAFMADFVKVAENRDLLAAACGL
ncbi:MAG: 2-oxo acid dehydrogenase subunit E2 [Armatimonadetes bacterium]|nr:2-oxo acid dehydrogenase subunit E2 [Armatimonadota bacterium]